MESLTHFVLGGTSFVTRGQETSLIKVPSGKVLELLGFFKKNNVYLLLLVMMTELVGIHLSKNLQEVLDVVFPPWL